MRIMPVTQQIQLRGGGLHSLAATNSIKQNNQNTVQQKPTLVHVSFTGVPGKNVKQGISVSVEDGYIGLDMYKSGGAGGVADQMPTALNKDGLDFRHAVPLYSYNNPKGQIKVLVVPKDVEYNPRKPMPENWFLSYPETMTKEQISKQLGTTEDRIKFVVQDTPISPNDEIRKLYNLTGKSETIKVSEFRELIPTETKGVIQRIDESDLSKIKSIPYKVYRMVVPLRDGTLDDKSVYCIHTPDLAKFQKAYTYSPDLKDHPHVNLFTRDFGDAAADMLPKMNTAEHGNFNPANVVAHCRTGFPITESIINRSVDNEYYRGFKIIDIFHNPMPDYQGTVGNPMDFLRYKATVGDYMKLSQMPEFPELMALDKHRYNLSSEEAALVDRIIKPFLQHYVDDNGNYNQSITPLLARKANPAAVSANHVSHTFANEVIKYNDMARGLTSLFREAEAEGDKIPGRPNGCNIQGMQINNPKAAMGKNNGLSADMSWYTAYDPATDPAEKIVAAKRKNTEAFLNMIGEATEKRLDKLGDFTNASVDDALNQLLYSKDLIEKKRYVLGGLSKFDPKDILLMGWGRSDAQKGYPVTLKGFLKFLERPNVPAEWKKHFKIALGSGPEPWKMDDGGSGDFHLIKDIMYKIQQLDNGAYKTNCMYGNGFFPNRLVTCATYGIFTSRGEPQGLSVPESLQSGTPSASLNTGGAGEMIITVGENAEKANGFKTVDAFMRDVEDLQWPEGTDISKLTGDQIDNRRIELAAEQVADMYEDMARVYYEKPDLYAKMAENGGRSKFDWHNNHTLNGGRSTLQLYTEDDLEIPKGWAGRDKNPMKRLVGEFGGKFEKLKRVTRTAVENAAETAQETLTKPSGSKWQKVSAYVILGALAVVGGGGLYIHRRNQIKKTYNGAENNQFRKVG